MGGTRTQNPLLLGNKGWAYLARRYSSKQASSLIAIRSKAFRFISINGNTSLNLLQMTVLSTQIKNTEKDVDSAFCNFTFFFPRNLKFLTDIAPPVVQILTESHPYGNYKTWPYNWIHGTNLPLRKFWINITFLNTKVNPTNKARSNFFLSNYHMLQNSYHRCIRNSRICSYPLAILCACISDIGG
jgi:hypothetical protein